MASTDPKSEGTTVEDALAVLKEAQEQTAKARQTREELRRFRETSEEEAKQRAANRAKLEEALGHAGDFEAQWESFKKRFDDAMKAGLQVLAESSGLGSLSSLGCSSGAGCSRPAEMVDELRIAQVLRRAKSVVILTGAGISAESGIPTFRGADGFWTVGSKHYRPQELATWEKWDEMPQELWRWYQYRWGICRNAKPNPGHMALKDLETLVEGGITLVTQNVDGLHLAAGSDRKRLYEIHGRVDEMRCDERVEGSCLHGLDLNDDANEAKALATVKPTPLPAEAEKDEKLPRCPACGVRQRPKILWFDECYNEAIYRSKSATDAVKACDVLLVIGTQLTTGLPQRLVSIARNNDAATVVKMDTIVDLEDPMSAGMLHLKAPSGEALPRIVQRLRQLREEPLLAPLAVARTTGAAHTAAAPGSGRSAATRTASTGGVVTRTPSGRRAAAKSSAAPKAAAHRGSYRRSPSSGTGSAPVRSFARSGSASGTASHTLTRPGSAGGGASGTGSHSTTPFAAAAAAALGARPSAAAAPAAITEEPHGFFVYGTLRPDDDSGASWTKGFCEGFQAEPATLAGASMYIDGKYAAVCLEHTACEVRGVLLTPATGKAGTATAAALMKHKLQEADGIEGYPELYDRCVLQVKTASGTIRPAYVYHRTGRTDRERCHRIADGDWMSRPRRLPVVEDN